MKDEFVPPIKERTTSDLLLIVGSPKKWNPKAVLLAKNELKNRNIPAVKTQTALYLSKKREKLEQKSKANESYHLCDFIDSTYWTLFEIIFSWELQKDGYHRKAKQQKYFRILLAIIIFLAYLIHINFFQS